MEGRAGFSLTAVVVAIALFVGAISYLAVSREYPAPEAELTPDEAADTPPPPLKLPELSNPPPEPEENKTTFPPPATTTTLPEITAPPIAPPPPATEGNLLPELRDINLRSIVAIRCTFTDSSGKESVVRGSGVLVHSEGYILTNRHIVDLEWADSVSGEEARGYKLKEPCTMVIPQTSYALSPVPRSTAFENPYPYFDLNFYPGNWDFNADVIFTPPEGNLSAAEKAYLDFAILKFTAWNSSKFFENQKKPELRPAPFLDSAAPEEKDRVLVPGYAYQAIGAASFDTFRLLTLTHAVSRVLFGDQRLENIPFVYETFTESADAEGGRSGSPMFWRGYVVGLFQSVSKSDRRIAREVSSEAISEILRENNMLHIFEDRR